MPGAGTPSKDPVAQSPIRPDLEHYQGWGIHNFSGQSVSVSFQREPQA